MTPSQLSAALRRIASKIDASENPSKELVIADLKYTIASVDASPEDEAKAKELGNLLEKALRKSGLPADATVDDLVESKEMLTERQASTSRQLKFAAGLPKLSKSQWKDLMKSYVIGGAGTMALAEAIPAMLMAAGLMQDVPATMSSAEQLLFILTSVAVGGATGWGAGELFHGDRKPK